MFILTACPHETALLPPPSPADAATTKPAEIAAPRRHRSHRPLAASTKLPTVAPAPVATSIANALTVPRGHRQNHPPRRFRQAPHLRGSREGWARGFTRRLRKESEKFSEACTAELFLA
jgi:hypothetical protein